MSKSYAAKALEFIARDLIYTFSYSTIVGIGNGIAELNKGKDYVAGLFEGFNNNLLAGLVVNAVYPTVFNIIRKRENFRTWAHIANSALCTSVLLWHYYVGTENPLSACLPCYAVGTALTEAQVREIKSQELEEKVA